MAAYAGTIPRNITSGSSIANRSKISPRAERQNQ
ncbi:hypothetical protein [Wolbachia endosymbiont (group A) of Colletes cunicularius]